MYVDKRYHTLLKTRTVNGQGERVEDIFLDMREVDGLVLPFEVETYREGELVSFADWESAQMNEGIFDTLFAMPGEGQESSGARQ